MRGVPTHGDERRVLARILSELLRRRAPTQEELSAFTGLSAVAIERILNKLQEVGAIVTGHDGLLAAYPLSARPTPHVVELGFTAPWANCAIDALAVPAMAGRRGTIRSRCAQCGSPIAVQVEGTRALDGDPADIVVAYGGRADRCDRSSLEASCPYINFFCNIEHARLWQQPESWQGRVMPLREAVVLAVERFRHIISIYADCAPGAEAAAGGDC